MFLTVAGVTGGSATSSLLVEMGSRGYLPWRLQSAAVITGASHHAWLEMGDCTSVVLAGVGMTAFLSPLVPRPKPPLSVVGNAER
jgi:hypothetical protein